MLSDSSSEPSRVCRPCGAVESLPLLSRPWSSDIDSIIESLTDDSESLAESVWLTDS